MICILRLTTIKLRKSMQDISVIVHNLLINADIGKYTIFIMVILKYCFNFKLFK